MRSCSSCRRSLVRDALPESPVITSAMTARLSRCRPHLQRSSTSPDHRYSPACAREPLSHPRFHLIVMARGIAFLSGLVIGTPDDEDVAPAVRRRSESDVVIRIFIVPHERARHAAAFDCGRQRVGLVSKLLHVDGDPIDERRVRCHDRRARIDLAVLRPDDHTVIAIDDFERARVAEDTAAQLHNRLRKPGEIAQRMKLRLSRKLQSRRGQ